MYQYEIQFEPSSEEDFEDVEALTAQGLLEFDSETEYYSFYHSDFARLLLKSHAARQSFRRKYREGLQQFTVEQIKTYILSFKDHQANLPEVFSNLVANNGIDVLNTLLEDERVRIQTIRFYQNADSVRDLVRFLNHVEEYCPGKLGFFVEDLATENPIIKALFLETEDGFSYFISLLKIVAHFDKVQYEVFRDLFNPQELVDILLNSNFSQASVALCVWAKFDSESAKGLYSLVDVDLLIEMAQILNLSQLGSVLSHLGALDYPKSAKILEGVRFDDLATKVRGLNLSQIGTGLDYLGHVDCARGEELFDIIDLETLVRTAQETDFGRLGAGLSHLRQVNYDKAREIFQKLGVDELAQKAEAVEFAPLGQALARLSKVDKEKAREIFQKLELDELAQKAGTVGFAPLGQALARLNKVDENKAAAIFQELELDEIAEKARKTGFPNLQQGISQLRLVSQEKAGGIWESIELESVIPKAIDTKYSTFLCHLPGLALASPTKTRDLILQLPDEFLFQFDHLRFLANFNRLLFVFYTSECEEMAQRLATHAQGNVESFLRSKILKDLTSFLNLCSHYFDTRNVILQNREKWFGKVRYGEPSEIPYFIRVINDHDMDLASEILDYVESIIKNEGILAWCYYNMALSFAEQEDFAESTAYLKEAVPLFRETEDNGGLCCANFALAQNALKLGKTQEAKQLAGQALSYAEGQGTRDLRKEIESFIATELH